MTRLSPGLAQGCHELLLLTSRHVQPPAQLLRAFDHFSSIPSDRVFETAQTLGWLHVDEHGLMVPTAAGLRLLSVDTYASRLRQMLLDYIDVERPSWLQSAVSGRAKVLAFASAEIRQVFIEADLAETTAEDVVAFWDSVAARARGLKDAHLLQIGRMGERLSLAFEERRTKRKARWVSLESNEDGYDILSVGDAIDLRKLSIEVKTTNTGLHAHFYVTANEWERAQEALLHCFHLWDVSASVAHLSVVSIQDIEQHIPNNNGVGDWQSVRIPFRAFGDRFRPFSQ